MIAHLWFVYALIAAVAWGFSYAVSERVIKDMLPVSFFMFLQYALGLLVLSVIALLWGTNKEGLSVLQSNPKFLLPVMLVTLSSTAGWFFILKAFELKNATLVNMIEISYPLFTLLFAWVLFKDVQLNWAHAVGGLMVFAGVSVIFLKG